MIVKIIQSLHLLLVLIVIFSIFIKNKKLKSNVFVFLIFLLFHYGKCGLTEFEYLFTQEKYKEGFLYRLIKPVITMPEKYFDKYLIVLHLVWIIILYYQIYT